MEKVLKIMQKKIFLPSLVIFYALVIALFTVSCEIGLGPAVDTQAPVLTIDYPPTNAVIRSTFQLSGSCDDDDSVASVQVSLRNTTTEETYGPYNASLENDGKSWKILLNNPKVDSDGNPDEGSYNGWEFPDGSYTVNVMVYDGVGRSSGPFSRSIAIDNTAPIFIISSPTTATSSDSKYSKYGTTLRVSGTVAESHDISQMLLTVYDAQGVSEGTELELSQENVDVSDGAAVDFARYQVAKKDETSGLTKDYKDIYGEVQLTGEKIDTSNNSAKDFTASFYIADNAKVYNPSSSDENPNEGNSTTVVYLSSEVYTETLGAVSADDLIACVNGTYSEVSSLGDDVASSIVSKLSDNAKETTEESGKLRFSLNPGARPTYGIDTLTKLENDISSSTTGIPALTAASRISASAKASQDSKNYVNSSTLKMVYYNLGKLEDDAVFKKSEGENSLESKVSTLESEYYASKKYPAGWVEIGSGSGVSAETSVFTGAPNDVAGSNFYLVAVLGEDVSGTNLYHDEIYVFIGQAYTTPPSVTIDAEKPESEKYFATAGGIVIAGEASSGGNNITNIEITVTQKDNDNSDNDTNSKEFKKEYKYEGSNSKRAVVFPPSGTLTIADILGTEATNTANTGKNFTYTIVVKATDSEGITNSVPRKVYLDSKKPVVNVKEPVPTVTTFDSSDNIYVNGKISVDITADDKNLSEVKYRILAGGTADSNKAKIYDANGDEIETDDFGYASLGDNTSATIFIDTTKYEDGKSILVQVYAQDNAGNKSDVAKTKTYVIKQESDKPVIEVRNANQELKAKIDPQEPETLDETNLFDLTSKKSLNIHVSDDDTLAKVSLKVFNSDGTTEVTSQTGWTTTPSGLKATDFAPSLESLSQGIYKIVITAEDSTYEDAADSVKSYRTDSVEFWIEVDKDAPVLAENSETFKQSQNEQLVRENFTLSGTASDTHALYTSEALAQGTDSTKNGKQSVTITALGGSSGNKTTKTLTVDVEDGNWSQEFRTGEEPASDEEKKNYLSDGSYEITIEVKDIAQKTAAVVRNVTIDTQNPVFSTSRTGTQKEIEITTEKTTLNDSEKTVWYKTTALDINGNAYDENGIKSVKYAKITSDNISSWSDETGPSGIEETAWKNLSFEGNEWTGVISDVKHGETLIAVRIEDNAGNVSFKKTAPVNIDTLSPERTANSLIVKIGDKTFVDETAATPVAKTVLTNKTKPVEVTLGLTDSAASGNSGMSGLDTEVYYSVGTNFSGDAKPVPATGNTFKKATLAAAKDSDGNEIANVYTFNIETSAFSENGGTTYLRFYDKAGNYKDETLFSISVDTIQPVARITSSESASSLNGTKTVSGTVSEANTPAKLVLYYSATEPKQTGSKIPGSDDSAFGTTGTETTTLVKIDEVTDVSAIYNWSFENINFNEIAKVAYTKADGSKKVYIVPVVYDEAGNCNVYKVENGKATYNYTGIYKEYTVDLDTDRPSIKITSLSKDGETIKLVKDAAISGSVTDDDEDDSAVVKEFIASSKPFTAENLGDDGKITDSAKSAIPDAITFNSATGEWTYKPQDSSDGIKNVYFYIEDNDGNVFYTGQPDDSASGTAAENRTVLKMPKISYKTSAAVDNKEAVTYISDTLQPAAEKIIIQWADSNTKTAAYDSEKVGASGYNGPDGESESLTVGTRLGGTERRYARFVITAKDATGISKIKLEFPSKSEFASEETTEKTFTPTKNGENAVWTTGYIDLSQFEGTATSNGKYGTVDVKVTITDQSGLYSNATRSFSVDNVKPEISITSPKSSEQVTGKFSVEGRASDEGGAGLSNVKWMIKPAAKKNVNASEKPEEFAALEGWTNFASASTWSISFTEDEAKEIDTNTDYAITADDSSAIEYEEDGKTVKMGVIYSIPFLIYAEDGVGNYSIEERVVEHNPDATIPSVNFMYPTEDDYDKNYTFITLGGPVRVSGSAQDNGYVKAVYIQIDYAEGDKFDGTWDKDVKIEGDQNLSDFYTITTDLSGQGITNTPSGWWGILADGTSSWAKIINADGELAPEVPVTTNNNDDDDDNSTGADDGKVTSVRIRACAVDNDGHLSAWSSPVCIKFDNQAPKIGADLTTLLKFDSDITKIEIEKVDKTEVVTTTPAPAATNTYVSNMFLRNDEKPWYLVLSATDNFTLNTENNYADAVTVYRSVDGGSESKLTGVTVGESGDYIYGDRYTSQMSDTNPTPRLKSRFIYIPITGNFSQNAEQVSYHVVVKDQDNSVHVSEATYTFKIDNTAPTFEKLTDGSDIELAENFVIQNSDGEWVLKGESKEEGSGFERMAFFFTRTYDSSTTKIFDATLQNRTKEETDNSTGANGTYDAVDVSSLAEVPVDGLSGAKLYGIKYNGKSTANSAGVYTFSASGIGDNVHIRKGGLIYIDGLLRLITAKDGNTVTFDTAVEGKNSVEAIFPYAHIIDRSESDDDDGDGIDESLSSQGGTHTFSASFNSHNIPDGPVTLTCLLFDKAGNVQAKTVSGEVKNNAPRLAKLYLGTDLNGDGKFGNGEFQSYLAGAISPNQKEVERYVTEFDFATADGYGYEQPFKVTDKLAVVPEYTGGNGELLLAYNKDAASITGFRTTAQADKTIEPDSANVITADDFDTLYKNAETGTDLAGQEDKLAKFVILDNLPDDGTGRAISLTFWDKTDGKTQGTDTNYFFVRISDLTFAQGDLNKPNVVINKFYWNSLKDNSIYGSASAKTFDDLQGHIELEADWEASGNKEGTTGEYDGDPKVSGSVVFTGTAYDDHVLTAIKFSFGKFSDKELATYTPGTGWDVPGTSLAQNGYEFKVFALAKESDSDTATVLTLNDDGYYGNYENNTAFISQDGHKVYWELAINTEELVATATADQTLTVIATDKKGNSTATTATDVNNDESDEKHNVPTYRVDVVPYITGITTSLSEYDTDTPSTYSRTALGHYPVWTTRKQGKGGIDGANLTGAETVTVTGFNMKNTSVELASDATTTTINLTAPSAGQNGRSTCTFQLTKKVTSGALTLKTGTGITSLNNKNYDDAKGDYSYTGTIAATGDYNKYLNFYNRQPNKTTNARLTDDVFLDVWDFNTQAAIPSNNSALDVMMKIHPTNGLVGFAFCDGDSKFAMASGTSSYKERANSGDFMKSTGFAYGSDGISYGTAAGGDSQTDVGDMYNFYTSKWTDESCGSSKGGTNNLRIDFIGQYGTKADENAATRGAFDINKDRFQSPSFAISGKNVYLAYYDEMNGEIRFRAGTLPNTKQNFGTFTDDYTNKNGQTVNDGKYTSSKCQVVVDGSYETFGHAGEYVSIAVTKVNNNDIVIMVWYDSSKKKLKYTYNDTPLTKRTGIVSDLNRGWHEPMELMDSGGKFCQVVVDSDGKVHVAAYDTKNANVVYIYIGDYNSKTFTSYIVDSYKNVGQYLTLDVAKQTVNGNDYQIPYIGYWGTSPAKPHMAYLAKPEALGNGAEKDMFTGIWECTVVPVESKLPKTAEKNDKRNRINIGVWKDASGKLTDSKVGGQIIESTADNGKGKCYGNGTSNPILGYRVNPTSQSGYVETAQKK